MSAASSHALSQKLAFNDLRLLQTDLVWIYEGEVSPLILTQETLVPEQSAFFICEGGVTITNEYGESFAKTGEWIFPREGSRKHQFSPGTTILSIRFNLAWPGGQRLFDWGKAFVIEGAKVPDLYASAKRLERLVEGFFPDAKTKFRYLKSDVDTHLLIHGGLQEWLYYYVRALSDYGLVPARFGKIDSRALQVLQRLDRHSFLEPFCPTELARNVCLSVSQLDRLFGKSFGVTPKQYLERRRLDEVVLRLHGTSDPIKQIAYDFGFRSLAHFSAWLRRKTSLSPRQLRAEGP